MAASNLLSFQDLVVLVHEGQSERALTTWRNAGCPQDADILAVVAHAQIELGQLNEALTTSDAALSKVTNHPSALLASAMSLQRLKRPGRALERWLRLLRAKPEHPGAINAVRKALEKDPSKTDLANALQFAEAFGVYAPARLPVWEPERALANHPISEPSALYLDLMVRTVSGWILADGAIDPNHQDGRFDEADRETGRDWPRLGHSMAGLKRLQQLREACETVVVNKVPGDFIEAGVWRGGACILMRAVLAAHGDATRNVWVADSFAGVPGEAAYAEEDHFGVAFHQYQELAVSREQVAANFSRYGLLDERVRFLEGLFSETLMTSPIERLAVLRLDGDLYSSTMETLEALYPRLSSGGYVIIDDYGVVNGSRRATLDYRNANGISDPMINIDDAGVFWVKS